MAVLSACSSNSSSGFSPSPLPPPPSISLPPVPTPSTGPGSPIPLPVSLHSGSAHVRVTGGLKAKLTLPLRAGGAYARSPGSFSVSFIDRRGNALIVDGTTPTGHAKTSSALTLSIVVQAKKANAFPSSQGECTVTFISATASGFSARFRCGKLSRGGKTIRASGTFSASR
jgi:hypothetical protein